MEQKKDCDKFTGTLKADGTPMSRQQVHMLRKKGARPVFDMRSAGHRRVLSQTHHRGARKDAQETQVSPPPAQFGQLRPGEAEPLQKSAPRQTRRIGAVDSRQVARDRQGRLTGTAAAGGAFMRPLDLEA
jgi:hypothetical protein